MGSTSDERRREQNRLAQRRFREKHRQQREVAESQYGRGSKRSSTSPKPLESELLKQTCVLDPLNTPVSTNIDLSPTAFPCHSSNEIVQAVELPRSWTDFGEPLTDTPMTSILGDDFALSTTSTSESTDLEAMQDIFESLGGRGPDAATAAAAAALAAVDPAHQRSDYGTSPLHIAVQRGRFRIVRLLIENGAEVDKRDDRGLTPLLHATIEGHEDVADLLLSYGAGLQYVDNQHRSAFHWSVLRRRDSLLRKLLRRCAGDTRFLDGQTKDGLTPLFLAVDTNNEVAVDLLLEFGAKAQ